MRYVSTTEAYVNALLTDLLVVKLPPPSTFVRGLVNEVEAGATRDWGRRLTAFNRLHGVKLKDCSRWKDVEAATQARNCIAHGLGRLTPSQRGLDFATKVGLLGMSVSGGTLIITDASVETTFAACREFIGSVDAAI